MLLPATIVKVILLALVDCLRIKHSGYAIANLNHKYSVLYDVIASCAIAAFAHAYFFDGNVLHAVGKIALYIAMVVFTRGLFYDVALNLMRGLRFDYVSTTTSAVTDQAFNRWGFMERRLLAAVVLVIVSILYFLV